MGPRGPGATRGTSHDRGERRLSGLPHGPARVSHYVPVSDYRASVIVVNLSHMSRHAAVQFWKAGGVVGVVQRPERLA